MRCWLLLFALPLVATVNEPCCIEWFTGYRNDRLHWHVREGGEGTVVESGRYRNIQFWDNGLRFNVIHRDLAFGCSGNYAAFGQGDFLLESTATRATGWASDAWGYFGYAANLTTGRTYKVILLPLLGFSAHFERLTQLRTTWYGFLLGGKFLIRPGGRLSFEAGYAYNWLRLHFRSNAIQANEGGNLGQTGWISGNCLLTTHWNIGLAGLLHYFSSTEIPIAAQKLKIRWVPVSGWLTLSRSF